MELLLSCIRFPVPHSELKKATGLPTDAAQTLFFTQDEKVLQRIQQQTLQNRPPSPGEIHTFIVTIMSAV